VTEGRVTEVVRVRNRLAKIFVGADCAGYTPRNLRYLQRVGEAGAVKISLVNNEDLRFVAQPSESFGMEKAVSILLKESPVQRVIRRVFVWHISSALNGPRSKRCVSGTAAIRMPAVFSLWNTILVGHGTLSPRLTDTECSSPFCQEQRKG